MRLALKSLTVVPRNRRKVVGRSDAGAMTERQRLLDDVWSGLCDGYTRSPVRRFLEPYALQTAAMGGGRFESAIEAAQHARAMAVAPDHGASGKPNLSCLAGGSYHLPADKLSPFLRLYAAAAERQEPLYYVDRTVDRLSRPRLDLDFRWLEVRAVRNYKAVSRDGGGAIAGMTLSRVQGYTQECNKQKVAMRAGIISLLEEMVLPRAQRLVREFFPRVASGGGGGGGGGCEHDERAYMATVLVAERAKIVHDSGLGCGVHVVWPHIATTMAVMSMLRSRLVELLGTEVGTPDGMEPWPDVVDPGVTTPASDGISGTGLRLVWSDKTVRCTDCERETRVWQHARLKARRGGGKGAAATAIPAPECSKCEGRRMHGAYSGGYAFRGLYDVGGTRMEAESAAVERDYYLVAWHSSVWALPPPLPLTPTVAGMPDVDNDNASRASSAAVADFWAAAGHGGGIEETPCSVVGILPLPLPNSGWSLDECGSQFGAAAAAAAAAHGASLANGGRRQPPATPTSGGGKGPSRRGGGDAAASSSKRQRVGSSSSSAGGQQCEYLAQARNWQPATDLQLNIIQGAVDRLRPDEFLCITRARQSPGRGPYVAWARTPFCANLRQGEQHHSDGVVYFVVASHGIQQRCASQSSTLSRTVTGKPCRLFRPPFANVLRTTERLLLFGSTS